VTAAAASLLNGGARSSASVASSDGAACTMLGCPISGTFGASTPTCATLASRISDDMGC